MTDRIRIATRGSALALWQAHYVEAALHEAHQDVQTEIEVIRTTGDRITDVPLSRIGDRGLFTKELDHALLDGTADLAVHSLKDVPTRLPDGLVIGAVSEREDPRDALILPLGASGDLATLRAGARVGTSSLRRRAQLFAARPDVEVVDLRGNLNTRMGKLDSGDYDAIILAVAGVKRLGWLDRISTFLEPPQWLPAVGQGALAIVTRVGDAPLLERLRALHHPDTGHAVAAERAFLNSLEGGCQIPIGALAAAADGEISLAGLVADLDGRTILRDSRSGRASDARQIGEELADALRARGAEDILERIRGALAAPVAPP
ncbi:MAG: hydroxymethylbilane synthase [Gemmatimonadetes bacterium]|nr:hydroxymethylbilane synthase [Gemmatimonadota bacterium]